MKKILSFDFYQSKVDTARDVAVVYGLNSKQYKEAIEDMQTAYKLTKLPFLYKIINLIAKISWQMKKQRY